MRIRKTIVQYKYLQFEIQGSALHAFMTAGRGSDSQPLPAGLFVPCQTHFNSRCLIPCPPHGAIHFKQIEKKFSVIGNIDQTKFYVILIYVS